MQEAKDPQHPGKDGLLVVASGKWREVSNLPGVIPVRLAIGVVGCCRTGSGRLARAMFRREPEQDECPAGRG